MRADTSSAATPTGTEGFLSHIRQLGASVLKHAAMRAELLSIEVQEEKARLIRLAISAFLLSALVIVTLVLLAILVLVCYWDTPQRVTAAVVLAGLFGALTAACYFYLAAQLKRSTTLFATSAAELRRDAEALESTAPTL